MVGAATGLTRRAAALALRAAVPLLLAAWTPLTLAATASYVVSGNCRDGRPHGAYELRMPDGRLRVSGAFNQGKRIGSFLFWNAAGARIAHLPFDDDAMNGTVALWYLVASTKTEPKPKLEAAYANGVPAGDTRSWYPDGRPRAQFHYDQGVLAEARAWSAKGSLLSEAESRALAARDRAADEQFYNTLLRIVRDNPPPCEIDGRKP